MRKLFFWYQRLSDGLCGTHLEESSGDSTETSTVKERLVRDCLVMSSVALATARLERDEEAEATNPIRSLWNNMIKFNRI